MSIRCSSFWGSLIPVPVAAVVYAVMRRKIGRTAIWPALIVLRRGTRHGR